MAELGGEPMGDCSADRFADGVTQPTFVLRPGSGRHGSSTLNPERVEGDTEPTWEAVLEFLALVSAR